MDTTANDLLMLDKIIQLVQEGLKFVTIFALINQIAKAEDESTKANLSMALGGILNFSPHLQSRYDSY